MLSIYRQFSDVVANGVVALLSCVVVQEALPCDLARVVA